MALSTFFPEFMKIGSLLESTAQQSQGSTLEWTRQETHGPCHQNIHSWAQWKSQACLCKLSWTSHLDSLSFSFLVQKMKLISHIYLTKAS